MEQEKPLVLVTGASGYIAAHIVKLLLSEGYRVRGTVRNLKNAAKTAPLRALGAAHAAGSLMLVEAELSSPVGWDAACAGCTFVMHVASPVPAHDPKHEDEVIKPAVEGTLNVLRAALRAGTVKRVVLTSSSAAMGGGWDDEPNHVYGLSREDWSRLDKLTEYVAYTKSKTLAERAAWQFVSENPSLQLVTINPMLVLGPVLTAEISTSNMLISKLLQGEMPALPNLNFEMVDVRDVALAHVRAMTLPGAVGHRYLCWSANMHISQVAKILSQRYSPQGWPVPSRSCPYWLAWLFARFDPTVRLVLSSWGKLRRINNDATVRELGISFRPVQESILDAAESLISRHLVHRPKSRGLIIGTSFVVLLLGAALLLLR